MGYLEDKNVVDIANEIIATGDNCQLPYVKILGERIKKAYINELILKNRINGK
jgi:hypothetical protein